MTIPLHEDRLRREANYLYRVLFNCDAPQQLADRYISVLSDAPLAEWPSLDLDRIASSGGDLEAIEFALRRQRPRNALTQRFQVLSYLAEVQPERFEDLVNERQRWFTGWVMLVGQVIRSGFKLAKGRRLLIRYGIS